MALIIIIGEIHEQQKIFDYVVFYRETGELLRLTDSTDFNNLITGPNKIVKDKYQNLCFRWDEDV